MRFKWNRKESELELEVQYHLESLAESFERQGLSKQEAMLRARRACHVRARHVTVHRSIGSADAPRARAMFVPGT